MKVRTGRGARVGGGDVDERDEDKTETRRRTQDLDDGGRPEYTFLRTRDYVLQSRPPDP